MPRSEIAGTHIGETCTGEAQKMGFSKKTAVVVGGHDIAVSAIGAGAITPGIWMDLTGTYEFIRAPLSSKDKTRRLLCGGVCNSTDIHVLGGKIDTSGALFRWFRDSFGHEELVESKKTGADPYDLLTQRASKANLGSDDLLFIPDFRNARGAFIGLTLKHKKNEFVRAILEGLTFELRHVFDLLEQQGVEAKEIRAIGGGAKSAFWLQLKADITKKTIIRPVVIECGSQGAAILAGIGVDVYSGVEDGIKVTYQIKAAYKPRKDRSEIYDALYQKYLRIRAEINTLYERMMPLG